MTTIMLGMPKYYRWDGIFLKAIYRNSTYLLATETKRIKVGARTYVDDSEDIRKIKRDFKNFVMQIHKDSEEKVEFVVKLRGGKFFIHE